MLNLKVGALPAAAFMATVSIGSLWADSSWGQDQLSFTRQDTSLGDFAGPNDSATGDFNGDGEVDLVITADDTPHLRILLGNGDGTFQAALTPPIEEVAGSVTVADLNDDGRQDLAVSLPSNVLAIRLGNGDGTFQAAPDINTDAVPGVVATGDFNGDDAQDLAVSTFFNGVGSMSIYLGAGDGTFSRGQELADGTPFALTPGDFNGDGQQDLVAIDFIPEHTRVVILLGQGDGTFAPVAQASEVAPAASSLTLGDFNGDGRLDVATADGNNDVVSVLIGNGDGTFEAARNFAAGVPPDQFHLVQPLSIGLGDFNGDGRQDLATGNRRPNDPPTDGSASVLLGRGDGTFETAQEFAAAEGTQSLVVADFNKDGRQDLATFGDSERTPDVMSILLNDASISEIPVTIDIKPNDSRNRINPRSSGKVRVAVLTEASFDATEVDPATVRLGRTGTEAAPVHFALKDVDGDGNTDIVLRFRIHQTGIACGDTSASLTATTFGGQRIEGSDSIGTTGCKKH